MPKTYLETVIARRRKPTWQSRSPKLFHLHRSTFFISKVRYGFKSLLTLCLIVALATPALAQDDAPADSLERSYASELPRIPHLEPGEAIQSFETHPDFEMQLVASEPLVHDPIGMAFDEYGRMFVIEMRGYSEMRDEDIGAIRLLEDTDGDGVMDKSHVYVDGLAWPTAVACYDGGIFIGIPPDILYAKDTDGDHKADIVEKVFTGFGLTNVQGLINTFKWNLDNRIHGATSSSGGEIRPADDPSVAPLNLRGRDFSIEPRTRAIRAESGGAQHGMSFDLMGRKFVCSNSDHAQLILYEDRHVARNPFYAPRAPRISIAIDGRQADVFRISPIEPWRIVRTRLRVQGLVPGPVEGGGTPAGYFTGSTGITVYKGDAWPAEYRNNLIVGDVGSNLIHRKVVTPDGIALKADRARPGVEFVASKDIWFRPAQFCNAPDGTLYVADMYREVIEHPASLPPIIKQHLDLNSGNDRGRIWRIAPKGFKHAAPPRLGEMDGEALAEYVTHPNAWHHETAARLLYERQDKTAVNKLRTLTKQADTGGGKYRAMYALAGLSSLNQTDIRAAILDADPWVRAHAARLSQPFLESGAPIIDRVRRLADDLDPIVRYHAAFALGASTSSKAPISMTNVLQRSPSDPWIRVAALSGLPQGGGETFRRLALDLNVLRTEEKGNLLRDLARLIGVSANADDLNLCVASIERMLPDFEAVRTASIEGLLRGAQESPNPEAARDALGGSRVIQSALEKVLQRNQTVALDAKADAKNRVRAVHGLSLARFEQSREVLNQLLTPQVPASVQAAALGALSSYAETEVTSSLLELWPALSPRLREHALTALLARPERAEAFLDAIADEDIVAGVLDSTQKAFLLKHPNASVQRRAEQVLKSETGSELAHKAALAMTGDAAKGRTIFQELCAQCHQLGGLGNELGPDLAAAAQRGRETVLLNIANPNAEVHPQYTAYAVTLQDGNMLTGIISDESATAITVKQGGGIVDTLLRARVEDVFSLDISLMPEGLLDDLESKQVADLLAFIEAAAQR